jgi:hypothetical protein
MYDFVTAKFVIFFFSISRYNVQNKGKNSVTTRGEENRSFDKNQKTRMSSFAFVFLLVSGLVPFQPSFSNDFTAQKSMLLQKLDSLDMEKQVRKRKGQSIDDLEKLSAIIKDSIAGVKKEFALGESPSAPAPKPDNKDVMMKHIRDFRKYLPQNTFDWIVVIVGFVAIIAGGILFIGLVGIAWKKIFGKKKQPLKTMHDIFPRAVEKSDAGHLSKPGEPDTEERDQRIDFLRRKIKEDGIEAAVPGSGPDPLQSAIPEEGAGDMAGLRSRIIAAAGLGADIPEISKRFHVSIDQVSLILRVARQEKETGR